MPNTVVVEDVTLTRLAHGKAIHFTLVIVGDDDFTSFGSAPCQEMSGEVLFTILV